MTIFNKNHYVFFISGGRTGTNFFGTVLQKIINNCFSAHEPDVLKLKKNQPRLLNKFLIFGFYHMLFGRIMGKTGIRNLSQKYLAGKLSLQELEFKIIQHRKKYYNTIFNDLIIECYSGWYGCIPAIQNIFNKYKIVIITRDPRYWVISNMNWETLFGKRDWSSILKLGRLNPKMVNDQKYIMQWKHFNRFQKICWTYKYQYETMLENTQYDPNALVIKFEDLFFSKHKYNNLLLLLNFITDFGHKKFSYSVPDGILDKPLNKNLSYDFPDYNQWNVETKMEFYDICSSIMKKLNYAKEK